jgi:hypothetical protein
MKFELRCGTIVQIDEQDALRFVGISMWITDHGYVRVSGRHGVRERYLHREIMVADANTVVDHINGDKLDNCRKNLRLCTQQQNSFNSRTPNNNLSGIKGVYWCNKRLKWVAQVAHNGKTIPLGRYADFQSAVNARLAKEIELFGEYSSLNGVMKS